MTWAVPSWYALALLALAAFRTFHLLAFDTILDRPRGWFTSRAGDYWEAFVLCAWCAGFWISLLWWLAWVWQPRWTLVAAIPLAISALVALVAANLDPAD